MSVNTETIETRICDICGESAGEIRHIDVCPDNRRYYKVRVMFHAVVQGLDMHKTDVCRACARKAAKEAARMIDILWKAEEGE